MNDISLPVSLELALKDIGIKDVELIQVNLHKGRYCFACTLDGKKAFVKWNDCREDQFLHKQLLMKERTVLKSMQVISTVPRILDIEDMIAMEYLNRYVTFRKYLLGNC